MYWFPSLELLRLSPNCWDVMRFSGRGGQREFMLGSNVIDKDCYIWYSWVSYGMHISYIHLVGSIDAFFGFSACMWWNYVHFHVHFCWEKSLRGWCRRRVGSIPPSRTGTYFLWKPTRVLSHGYAGFANELLELDGPFSGGCTSAYQKRAGSCFQGHLTDR